MNLSHSCHCNCSCLKLWEVCMNRALYSQHCQKISFNLVCCENNNAHFKLVVHRRCKLLNSLVSVLGSHTNAAKSVNYDLLNHSGTPTTAASSGAHQENVISLENGLKMAWNFFFQFSPISFSFYSFYFWNFKTQSWKKWKKGEKKAK